MVKPQDVGTDGVLILSAVLDAKGVDNRPAPHPSVYQHRHGKTWANRTPTTTIQQPACMRCSYTPGIQAGEHL